MIVEARPQRVGPTPEFTRSVIANLAYWRRRTGSKEEEELARLDPDRQNLYRALQYGLQVPEAWPIAAEVALQASSFVMRRMIWPEWIPILERLHAQIPEDNLPHEFKLLIGLGRLHRLNMNLQEARAAFREAEKVAGKLGDRNLLAEAAYNLGFTCLRQRQHAQAEQYGKQVLELLSDFEEARPLLVAEAHRTLGEVAGQRGELEQAEAYLRTAVALWRDIGRPAPLARNIDALANVLRMAGKYDEAITLYEEASRLLKETNNELDKTLVQINLGVLYFNMDDLAAAEYAFRQADSSWLRRSGNQNYQALATFNLGNVLLAQERWDEAEPLLRRAIRLQEQMEDEVSRANAVGSLGECLAGQGETAAAEAQFDQAIGYLERYPDDAKARRLLELFRGEKAKLLN